MGVNVSQSDNGVARQYQRSLVGHRDSLREKRREKQTEGGSGGDRHMLRQPHLQLPHAFFV